MQNMLKSVTSEKMHRDHSHWRPTWIQGSRPRRSWKMYKAGWFWLLHLLPPFDFRKTRNTDEKIWTARHPVCRERGQGIGSSTLQHSSHMLSFQMVSISIFVRLKLRCLRLNPTIDSFSHQRFLRDFDSCVRAAVSCELFLNSVPTLWLRSQIDCIENLCR